MTDSIQWLTADGWLDERLARKGDTIGEHTVEQDYALVLRVASTVTVIEGHHNDLEKMLLDAVTALHLLDMDNTGETAQTKERMRDWENGEIAPF